ncbi:hypothetical protein A2W54_00745 [Candidatus Giovannonibacteria bacterium RIFCSPHIGHO2_02_43_13]|uniref:Uncharacterized protein n=1 Tax=Candidatus Giovannonibacteria bacterium RIFCSPHIGHO2_02_43_13 TaxID=1798330 RepID=A0A1F5WV52_9BACT|nr:MAG: hypothetical protein A3E06_03855 [Candidatus Giovannonibacteria bacterium RIFCSPHIGHO2_12_FULL_44_42]OGF79171.1 MAG: hypothetical protein A2W54_00745 [Candidatus Giovannonibacteria bacterium RIFCSPHIGHO2_02_43_13]OGF89071.1 MAG: hypothetical protein A3I94_02855 [Candidatus Giovannonibacteria bacterium RIFCSPLOWO2_02_FULL_43_54]OGF97524.1 MAG: hypothetical protein A3H08_00145 [Candidatus Giovannonibacteria bacterium RIFCSPLOWO2_12_FULL_44_32]
MKTIFIPISQALEAKNMLRTKVLANLLKDKDTRLVFLMANQVRIDYYKKEFNGPRMHYEVADFTKKRGKNLENLFSKLKYLLLRTETTDLRRRMKFEENGGRLSYLANLAFNRIFARSFIRRIVRVLDYALIRNNNFKAIFEKYKPDVVLLANLFDDPEIHILREAKKRGIKTIGFANTWDKVTARCIWRLLPDTAIVYNDILKQEMAEHNEMYPDNIFVSGIPQYDLYFREKPASRELFFDSIGIEPRKKLLVYAPNGKYSSGSDGSMIDLLHSLIGGGVFGNSEMLVRFQPNDSVDKKELANRPWLKYQIPGIRFETSRGGDWDMNSEDIRTLLNTLFHADLFICHTSSLSVDAAVFDKPVINMKFDLGNISQDAFNTRFYRMTHYKRAIDSGGIRVVNNEQELVDWAKKYLNNPRTDEEGRARLTREQVQFFDGKSGERIGDFILKALNS